MKNFIYLLSAVVLFVIVSCSSPEPQMGTYTGVEEKAKKTNKDEVKEETTQGKVLKGNHKLAKVKDNKYFYLYNSPNYSSLMCSFIWETNEGYFSSNYVYYSDIRFQIDQTVTEPYIKFHWDGTNSKSSIQSYVWNANYVVVVTNNMDFQDLVTYAEQNSQNVSSDN